MHIGSRKHLGISRYYFIDSRRMVHLFHIGHLLRTQGRLTLPHTIFCPLEDNTRLRDAKDLSFESSALETGRQWSSQGVCHKAQVGMYTNAREIIPSSRCKERSIKNRKASRISTAIIIITKRYKAAMATSSLWSNVDESSRLSMVRVWK